LTDREIYVGPWLEIDLQRIDDFAANYPGMRLRVNYGLIGARYPERILYGERIRTRSTQSVDEFSQEVQTAD